MGEDVTEAQGISSTKEFLGWQPLWWMHVRKIESLACKDFKPGLDDKTTIVLPNGLTIQKPAEDHAEVFCNAVRFLYCITLPKCTHTNKDEDISKRIVEKGKALPKPQDAQSIDDYRAKMLEWSWDILSEIMLMQEIICFAGEKSLSQLWDNDDDDDEEIETEDTRKKKEKKEEPLESLPEV